MRRSPCGRSLRAPRACCGSPRWSATLQTLAPPPSLPKNWNWMREEAGRGRGPRAGTPSRGRLLSNELLSSPRWIGDWARGASTVGAGRDSRPAGSGWSRRAPAGGDAPPLRAPRSAQHPRPARRAPPPLPPPSPLPCPLRAPRPARSPRPARRAPPLPPPLPPPHTPCLRAWLGGPGLARRSGRLSKGRPPRCRAGQRLRRSRAPPRSPRGRRA